MRDLFECEVGLSDHTLGIGTAVAAVALSATVIEKHFTLSRAAGGTDSAFSIEPHEMTNLVIETKQAWESIGQVKYGPTVSEQPNLKYRQSLYITHDMKAGEIFTTDNLRSIRPGLGLAPKYYEVVLGRKVNQNVKKGEPVTWNLF